jgi:transposase-like protein
VTVVADDIVGIDALEDAALAFARTAPAELIASTVESMIETLVDAVCGPSGMPIPDDEQITAPWACADCGSVRGFRRRGSQARQRMLTGLVGKIAIRAKMIYCRSCGKRFSPLGQLLGLRAYQRRTDALSEAAAALAVEVAYAKASRLLAEVGGVDVSARSIRRDVIALTGDRIGPAAGVVDVPVLMLDGTGERAGDSKGGVALHLAIGVFSRRTEGKRIRCSVELLGATLAEPWSVLFDLIANLNPSLIVVDGEEELSTLAAEKFASTPRQRCLWHLKRGLRKTLLYTDRIGAAAADRWCAELDTLLHNAWTERDLNLARDCLELLADNLDLDGAPSAAHHLRAAAEEVFTFLTHPDAGQLVCGHKGRPDVGTGVLERVMREMNRRTDVGVRWSIHGLRRMLMAKLAHKYHHEPWSPTATTNHPPQVRISLEPPAQQHAA